MVVVSFFQPLFSTTHLLVKILIRFQKFFSRIRTKERCRIIHFVLASLVSQQFFFHPALTWRKQDIATMSNSSEEDELIVDEGDNENDENKEAAGGVSEQVYLLSGNDKKVSKTWT